MRPPRGGGGFRGGGGGRGGGGFRGGRGGGFRDEGPPSEVVEVSTFLHACEGDAVTKLTNERKIPYFNAPIYLQNKTQIGKLMKYLVQLMNRAFHKAPSSGKISSTAKGTKTCFFSWWRPWWRQRGWKRPSKGGFPWQRPSRGGRGPPRGGSRGGSFRGRGRF
ncbi:hypothetical protein M0R45_008871 [Rubus argutus]|uniref:H/ACA ribonucleoprotein complex subunit n=1 Tax=Rubus argutus TaxID=59490 RepID=A0AAW1Y2H8_RUBAR